MKREALLALGLTEEQINQIMGMHGTATQNLRTQLTEMQSQSQMQQPGANVINEESEEMKQLKQQIASLQEENARKDILAYATQKGLTGKDIENVLAAYTNNVENAKKSIDALCSIITAREEAAATAKEQEIAKNATNPGGGNGGAGGGAGETEESNAEKIAMKFFGAKDSKNDILSHYVGGK